MWFCRPGVNPTSCVFFIFYAVLPRTGQAKNQRRFVCEKRRVCCLCVNRFLVKVHKEESSVRLLGYLVKPVRSFVLVLYIEYGFASDNVFLLE